MNVVDIYLDGRLDCITVKCNSYAELMDLHTNTENNHIFITSDMLIRKAPKLQGYVIPINKVVMYAQREIEENNTREDFSYVRARTRKD